MDDPNAIAELEGIPEAARSLWARLVTEAPKPVPELVKQVHDYQRNLARRSEWHDENIDPKLARALIDRALKLLGTIGPDTADRTRRLVQAAVRYLVIEDDATNDLGSILGLDDDAEVMNAVLRELGRESWQVKTR
jgi:uncharacterized membrane protein YkvA (DUF1232 family)